MMVWIDPDLCMGAGTCEQISPEVFHPRPDGTWVVKESAEFFGQPRVFDGGSGPGSGPDGISGKARVPETLIEFVIEAADECPGECIFLDA